MQNEPNAVPSGHNMKLMIGMLGLALVAVAQTPIAVQKIQIAEGIYQFATAPDGYVPNGNSIVIVNERDVVVFDTHTRPSTARTVLAEIRKITDKPVRYVVNSHHHPDHWSGNEVYAEAFPGLEIIASVETLRFMQNIANAWPAVFAANVRRAEAAAVADAADLQLGREFVAEARQVKRTFPTLTYKDTLTLYRGGREFRFMKVLGDAHGTTVLYLPKEKILMTGDAVSYPVPYVNAAVSEHAASLRALGRLDFDVIIPGHGPAWRDRNYLNLEADLLESIVRQVEPLVQNGVVTVEEMQKVVDVESLRVRFTGDDKDLNDQFRRNVNNLVENASREARDGRRFQ